MKNVVCWLTCAAIMLTSVSTLALAEKKTEKKTAKAAAKTEEKKVEKKTEKKSAFANETDKLSYAIGFQFGKDFKTNDIKVNPEIFVRGLQDGGKEKPEALMTLQEIQETLMAFQRSMMAKQEGKMKELAEKNIAASKAFMEANAKKEGVKSLPSGLQYKILKEGDGPVPQATDKVSIHYKGSLINGTEFDSSIKRNEPFETLVTGTIPGMTEALKMMKVGSKWELFIPPSLGYGDRPGRTIPPNSVLIFEVELLKIVKEIPSTPEKK